MDLDRIERLARAATTAELNAGNLALRNDRLTSIMRGFRDEAIANDLSDEDFRAYVMRAAGEAVGAA